jgi:DnaJ-class molecular chaperone
MASKDYYTTLGVKRDASDKDIKQAYRRLARKYHPDVNPGDAAAEQKFKEVSEAYSVLGTPESRKKYDQFGHQAFSGGFDPFATGGRGSHHFSGDNLRDLFGNASGTRGRGGFADSFGSIFEDLFGAGQSRQGRDANPDLDVEQNVDIRFEDAVRGTTIQLRIPRSNGSLDRIQVRIPPGVDTGSRIRVAGKGQAGRQGRPDGDLYIITQVQPHAYFTRDGNDIICDAPVTLGEITLGAKIDVPTIDGKISMTIPPGTQNGRKFRLRGKGVPYLKGEGQGDQYVQVRVVLPGQLDDRSRALVEEFDQRNPLQPRAHMR